jgi:hypothetical protein
MHFVGSSEAGRIQDLDLGRGTTSSREGGTAARLMVQTNGRLPRAKAHSSFIENHGVSRCLLGDLLMVAATNIVVTLAATMVAIVIIGVLSTTAVTVRLSYNSYFLACFFSRNSIFLSQQISEQYFQAWLFSDTNRSPTSWCPL